MIRRIGLVLWAAIVTSCRFLSAGFLSWLIWKGKTLNIIGILGLAGSGKDAVASFIHAHFGHFIVPLARPLKEFAAEVFDFSSDQLWGPSQFRNAVDPRWGVSPRHVLQLLGTEFGRAVHPDLLVRFMLRKAREIEVNHQRGVVVPDVRFPNEVAWIKDSGGRVIKVVRPGAGLTGEAGSHVSEAGQDAIPDSEFVTIIQNDGTLEELRAKALAAVTKGVA